MPPIDRDAYRRQVLLDLAAAPTTLAPAVVGGTALAIGVATMAPWWMFAGVVGMLVSVGAAATRWVFGGDALFQRAWRRLQEAELRERDKALEALDRRLRRDNDPRPEAALRRLRDLYRAFHLDAAWTSGFSEASRIEIGGQVEKLFQGCIISLSRSQDLQDAASRMTTKEGKQGILEQRENIVAEIRQTVDQLGKTLDGLQALRVEKEQHLHDANLAQIRQDLDESLAVARRVEERLQSLEDDLSRRPSAERE